MSLVSEGESTFFRNYGRFPRDHILSHSNRRELFYERFTLWECQRSLSKVFM